MSSSISSHSMLRDVVTKLLGVSVGKDSIIVIIIITVKGIFP